MATTEMLLAELDREIATTRRLLERVPEDKVGWAPHAKSMKLGRLASHVAELPSWGTMTLDRDELDLAPPGAPPAQAANFATRREWLELFERNASDFRTRLAGTPESEYARNWSLKMGGRTVSTHTKLEVLRGFVFNHLVHHRAQLGVFLRMLDVPLPSSYGPTADEGGM